MRGHEPKHSRERHRFDRAGKRARDDVSQRNDMILPKEEKAPKELNLNNYQMSLGDGIRLADEQPLEGR